MMKLINIAIMRFHVLDLEIPKILKCLQIPFSVRTN